MAQKCKYGKLKSPYTDKKGVRHVCRQRPKRSKSKKSSKSRSCKYGKLKSPYTDKKGVRHVCRRRPKK